MEYLFPRYDSAKSFYKKAWTETLGNITTLYSYGTKVAYYDSKINKIVILGFYSYTTTRHIREFLLQLGQPWMSKNEMYYKFTKRGQEELKEKEEMKEQKKFERILAKEAKEKQKALEKQQIKEIKEIRKLEIKKELTAELGEVLSKQEIHRITLEEIKKEFA